MSDPTIRVYRQAHLSWPTYIGECCREWIMPVGFRAGRCGLCGERPTFKRTDDGQD